MFLDSDLFSRVGLILGKYFKNCQVLFFILVHQAYYIHHVKLFFIIHHDAISVPYYVIIIWHTLSGLSTHDENSFKPK